MRVVKLRGSSPVGPLTEDDKAHLEALEDIPFPNIKHDDAFGRFAPLPLTSLEDPGHSVTQPSKVIIDYIKALESDRLHFVGRLWQDTQSQLGQNGSSAASKPPRNSEKLFRIHLRSSRCQICKADTRRFGDVPNSLWLASFHCWVRSHVHIFQRTHRDANSG